MSLMVPDVTSTRRTRIAWSAKAIRWLSGDQCGAYRNPGPSLVICFSAPVPSAGRTTSSYSPLRSLQYATDLPSGDQRGYRSATPDDRVRFITAPYSAGAVITSPRASKIARWPVGETDVQLISDST